jgi:hypothetical protein
MKIWGVRSKANTDDQVLATEHRVGPVTFCEGLFSSSVAAAAGPEALIHSALMISR